MIANFSVTEQSKIKWSSMKKATKGIKIDFNSEKIGMS